MRAASVTLACTVSALLLACGGGGGTASSSNSAAGQGQHVPAGPLTLTDVLSYHNDSARTGQNLTETALTPANVNAASFAKRWLLATDGRVDAAPLIANGLTLAGVQHNVVYVASEHDSLYAYDVDSGSLLLQVSLLPGGETPSDARNCGQVSPEIGVTATPVIDRSAGPNGTLFVVAMSKDGNGNYYQRLHALDLLSLQDRLTPVVIHASAPGNGPNSNHGVVSFDSKQYKERGALLLSHGQILTEWASHCDIPAYNGWIMAFDEGSLAQTAVLDITPNGTEAALWDVAGLEADSAGMLYTTAGNGSFDTALTGSGQPSQQDYGNSVLKLALNGTTLGVADYFTPSNTVTLSDNDVDFGSGSPMLLPDQLDASGHTRHLMIAAGKDGTLYLLDRDHLGQFNAAANQVYQALDNALPGGSYSAPAYFNGSVYLADAGGTLKAYTLSQAKLSSAPSSQSSATFSYPGSAPAISADGSSNGIVWALQSDPNAAAVLHAYNPANLAQEYYNSTQASNGRDGFGNGNKFITPVIADGKVFIGTPSGVAVFGSM